MEQTNTKADLISRSRASDLGIGGEVTQPLFIAAQSLGGVLRNSMALYRANFRPLLLAYVLPTLPFGIAQEVGQFTKNAGLMFGGMILTMIVSIATTGAMTIIIADICLGNTASVQRSYVKLLGGGLWLRLLLTSVWQLIMVLLGFLFFLVPGIILSVRLFFTPSVVVLERLSGKAAFKRSLNLSKGHFWRLWGDTIVLSTVFIVAPVLVLSSFAGALGYAAAVHGVPRNALMLVLLPLSLVELLIYPLFFIGIVLLYYDLRVRKEAYDVAALSEDMMR